MGWAIDIVFMREIFQGIPILCFDLEKRLYLFMDASGISMVADSTDNHERSVFFWESKLTKNKDRDVVVRKELQKQGWKLLTIWECQLKNVPKLATRLRRFLEDSE